MADPGSGYGGPDAASQAAGEAMGAAAGADDTGFDFGSHDQGHNTQGPATPSQGFFGGLMDTFSNNPVATGLQAMGYLTANPALGIMGLAAHAGKFLGDKFGVTGPASGPNFDDMGPGDGTDKIQQIVPPAFNPIESMVGSDYVAYGGVGADQLRKQLFPYMNFNQPTQPGISGLVGEYAGVGQGTGLMTGPFGMSNTQV